MTVIREYRIPMPLTVEEFQRGQLYAVMDFSRDATDAQVAVEILENRPFEDVQMGRGQYTHKIYHIAKRLPGVIQALAPASALLVEERAWNAYPHCKTIITNPFLGERFQVTVESSHLPDGGTTENALNLTDKQLAVRSIKFVDISADSLTGSDEPYNQRYNVSSFRSEKPVMCAYKVVTAKFQVFGLQSYMEKFINSSQWGVFLKLHKQIFCTVDEWIDLLMRDIRDMEEETKRELDMKLNELQLETYDPKRSQEDAATEGAGNGTQANNESVVGSPAHT